MQVSRTLGVLYLITKYGFLFVFEINSMALLTKKRISQDLVLLGTRNSKTDGIICLNKAGSLFTVSIDQNLIVNHIITQCSYVYDNFGLALHLAQRYKLPMMNRIEGNL
jgi:clathrin heavy chain